MSEHLFAQHDYAVQIKRYSLGSDPQHTNTVRVYRYSPDRVCLQIRGEKNLASVTLPFDVAKAIAKALVKETQS